MKSGDQQAGRAVPAGCNSTPWQNERPLFVRALLAVAEPGAAGWSLRNGRKHSRREEVRPHTANMLLLRQRCRVRGKLRRRPSLKRRCPSADPEGGHRYEEIVGDLQDGWRRLSDAVSAPRRERRATLMPPLLSVTTRRLPIISGA